MSNKSNSTTLAVITQQINIFYPLVLSILTTVGNSLSFLVFTSSTFKNTASGFFFKYKSLADILNVYMGTLRYTYLALTGRDLKDTGPFLCYFFNIGVYEIDSVCSWISVLASLDRLYLVLRPTKYSSMSNAESRRLHIYSLLTIIVILTVINLFKILQIYYDWSFRPVAKCLVLYSVIFDGVNLTITVMIPFVLMVFSSSVIAHNLVMTKPKLASKNEKSSSGSSSKNEKSRSFVKTVLCLDVCFLVFNTPRFILQFINSIKSINTPAYLFALQISTVFKYSYYSLTIVFYMATNSLFRNKLFSLFKLVTPSAALSYIVETSLHL